MNSKNTKKHRRQVYRITKHWKLQYWPGKDKRKQQKKAKVGIRSPATFLVAGDNYWYVTATSGVCRM